MPNPRPSQAPLGTEVCRQRLPPRLPPGFHLLQSGGPHKCCTQAQPLQACMSEQVSLCCESTAGGAPRQQNATANRVRRSLLPSMHQQLVNRHLALKTQASLSGLAMMHDQERLSIVAAVTLWDKLTWWNVQGC